MPLARIGPKILYFVHIPKNGGGSVVAYLEQKGPVALRFRTRLQWSATTVQHMNADIYSKLVPEDFYDESFAVLRDPVERLKSEYRYRVARMDTTLTFGDWVQLVLQATRKDPFFSDNHIRPQVDFLRRNTRLFRFETGLDTVFDWIDSVTATPPGDRNLHRHETAARQIDILEETSQGIRDFYEADYKLLSAFEQDGRPAIRLKKLKCDIM
jgi:hypothetical protein